MAFKGEIALGALNSKYKYGFDVGDIYRVQGAGNLVPNNYAVTNGAFVEWTSDGWEVKNDMQYATSESIDEDIADLQEQIDDIAEKAGSGYTPKGEATVATLNALSGQENGELYTMTDAGTLTDGSLAVVAGDTVAWDATNEVWYKAMDYAPRQYGTNEVHNLPAVTAFRSDDKLVLDSQTNGTGAMSKDDLLKVTAENADQKNKVLIYLTSNATLKVDGYYNENSNKIWINYASDIRIFGKYFTTARDLSIDIHELATALNVSLETSPGGMADALCIDNLYNLVYNPRTNDFALKLIDNTLADDIIIIANRGGLILCGSDLISIQYAQKTLETDKRLQLYGAGVSAPYIEETWVSGGKVYFKCSNLVVRGSYSGGWTMAQIATELGVSLVTSPKGITDCLEIPNVYDLVLTSYGKLILRDRNKVRPTDIILIANVDGVVVYCGLGQYVQARFKDVEQSALSGGIPAYDVADENFASSLRSVTAESDTLLFFSDPHNFGEDGTYTASFEKETNRLITALSGFCKANSVDKVICGGDLLRTGDTQVQAFRKLGYFFGLTHRLFDCYMVVGNHDTNSMGKLDADSAANTGTFTNAQQIAAQFVNEGSTYYHKESPTTDYYILDTGTDATEMTSFRWEQIDWLANKLLTATKEHAIVAMHIYSNSTNDANWTSLITPMATNLQTLLGALNSRSSITLNGETYDFTNATQKVAVILCGHSHFDKVDTDGDVPVVAITRTFQTLNSAQYSIDAIVLDYGAGKMRCTRVGGYGSDRVVDIVV